MPDAESPQYGAYGQAGEGKADELRAKREQDREAQNASPEAQMSQMRAMQRELDKVKKEIKSEQKKRRTMRGSGDIAVHDGVVTNNGPSTGFGGSFVTFDYWDGTARQIDINAKNDRAS